jgi:hypothetical protein
MVTCGFQPRTAGSKLFSAPVVESVACKEREQIRMDCERTALNASSIAAKVSRRRA